MLGRCYQPERPFCPLTRYTQRRRTAPFTYMFVRSSEWAGNARVRWWLANRTYVVWQKSNETDILLRMNFILFTNQGYPLQNSSLGQLHSDGGVVSIVRSSAGRILLVYLSARRLPSSGYYQK